MDNSDSNLKDLNENIFTRLGVLPLAILAVGLGFFLAGIATFFLPNISAQFQERLEAVSKNAQMPVALITLGLGLICLFFLFKELRNIERKMNATTEHAFDREVAALLAALRPFAERLEERIGPVLTAAQKLVKPLDSLHQDLQKQGQKLEEISAGFEETKLLLSRCREDFTVMSRGGKPPEQMLKQFEELALRMETLGLSQKKLEEIIVHSAQAQNTGPAIESLQQSLRPALEKLQSTFTDSLGQLQHRQQELSQAVSRMREEEKQQSEKLRDEISKSQQVANQALEAASAAATASQRAAETVERSVAVFERMESAPRPAASKEYTEPAQAPSRVEEKPAPAPEPAVDAQTNPSPQEKRSIKDAIAKLRNLRGGPG